MIVFVKSIEKKQNNWNCLLLSMLLLLLGKMNAKCKHSQWNQQILPKTHWWNFETLNKKLNQLAEELLLS